MNDELKICLDVIAMALEKAYAMIGENEECEHPLEARIDESTMGHIQWSCKLCGYRYEKAVENGEIHTD